MISVVAHRLLYLSDFIHAYLKVGRECSFCLFYNYVSVDVLISTFILKFIELVYILKNLFSFIHLLNKSKTILVHH